MIRKLLSKISIDLYNSENRTNNYRNYASMRNHPGWTVHQKLIVTIANKMSEHMLSSEFSKLSAEDMKANQRAFYMTKEIIDFLLDPLKGAKNYAQASIKGATTTKPKGDQ